MRFPLRESLLLFAVSGLFLPLTQAQDDSFFAEFQFDKLKFEFWPSGTDNRANSDGSGSAITVQVDKVLIEGVSAQELRHCIDGDPSFCAYEVPGGDANKVVTRQEVESFENISRAVIKSAVPRVGGLAKKLQENVSVDGLTGKNSIITRVQFMGAEGDTSSEAQVIAYIDAKVTYDNDPKASRHVIKINDLSLKGDGFTYETSSWTVAAEGWGLDPKTTKPDAAKAAVNTQGYYSSQTQFESLSKEGLEITAAKDASKRSPGVEALGLLFVLALVATLSRRN